MPEGHSIRRLANQWAAYEGQRLILTSPQGRFTEEANLLSRSKLISTDAHGKHLFLEFERGQFIHIHLGLYGRFTWRRDSALEKPKDTVRLRLEFAGGYADLSGPTRCELIDAEQKKAVHERLGPDPLRADSAIDSKISWLMKSQWPVGKTVMDQNKIAGIGNVYRAELLFMLGWSPWRLNSSISKEEWGQLWMLSGALLKDGVTRSGGITTTGRNLPPPATLPPGTACASRTYVYKRTALPCIACSTPIEKDELASRTIYFCPQCQA